MLKAARKTEATTPSELKIDNKRPATDNYANSGVKFFGRILKRYRN